MKKAVLLICLILSLSFILSGCFLTELITARKNFTGTGESSKIDSILISPKDSDDDTLYIQKNPDTIPDGTSASPETDKTPDVTDRIPTPTKPTRPTKPTPIEGLKKSDIIGTWVTYYSSGRTIYCDSYTFEKNGKYYCGSVEYMPISDSPEMFGEDEVKPEFYLGGVAYMTVPMGFPLTEGTYKIENGVIILYELGNDFEVYDEPIITEFTFNDGDKIFVKVDY